MFWLWCQCDMISRTGIACRCASTCDRYRYSYHYRTPVPIKFDNFSCDVCNSCVAYPRRFDLFHCFRLNKFNFIQREKFGIRIRKKVPDPAPNMKYGIGNSPNPAKLFWSAGVFRVYFSTTGAFRNLWKLFIKFILTQFQAQLKFPQDYPYNPPTVRFLSKVWHPNVYEVRRVLIVVFGWMINVLIRSQYWYL